MISKEKGQNSVRACALRDLSLGPAEHINI